MVRFHQELSGFHKDYGWWPQSYELYRGKCGMKRGRCGLHVGQDFGAAYPYRAAPFLVDAVQSLLRRVHAFRFDWRLRAVGRRGFRSCVVRGAAFCAAFYPAAPRFFAVRQCA